MTQTAQLSKADLIRSVVGQRVSKLQRDYLDTSSPLNSEATATLARLRRCAVDQPGSDPRVWAITLAEIPDELRWDNVSSPAERSIHAGIVLYAVHQQSQTVHVHRQGISLGRAVRQLADARARDGEPDSSVIRRLHQIALANEESGRLYYLRGLITMMRSEESPIGMDYAKLAEDLWRMCDPYQDSTRVVARWGRDLHNRSRSTKSGESE